MRTNAFKGIAAATLALCACAGLSGCGNDRVANITDNKAALTDDQLSLEERIRVVDRIAAAAPTPEARRESLKEVAWSASNGYRSRNHAIDLLADDPVDPPPGHTDTRNMLYLLLGPEPDKGVVEHVSKLAADRGWIDLTPVLVRQLAKPGLNTPDVDRPEWAALKKLHAGKPVDEIAFEVFAAPEAVGARREPTERAREAAWQLLTRLDKDGSKRKGYLAAMADNPAPAMADVRAAANELSAVPLTASELSWLRTLRRPQNAQWWQQTAAAIATLDAPRREGFSLRHAEPVRWAAANEPSWLAMSRDQLAATVAEKLKGRELFIRSESGGDAGQGTERFADNVKKMVWADLVSLLVIDRAVNTPGLAEKLWKQAQDDQADKTTEYGGYIAAETGVFKAHLYAPRPTQRFSDDRFVASDDLLTAGATALVVYHFHAQKLANEGAAGPSGGDIDYAKDSGRLCIVATPVRPGVFDIDAYFGQGVRCDLGAIGQPPAPSAPGAR